MAKRIPLKGLLEIADSKLKKMKISDLRKYGKHFSEASLSDKLKAVGHLLGENILLPMLQGYYVLISPTTKSGEKAMLIGSLGYFILPFDLIPDFLLGVLGYSDDLVVISFVLAKIKKNITPEIEERALRAYRRLIGEETADFDLLKH